MVDGVSSAGPTPGVGAVPCTNESSCPFNFGKGLVSKLTVMIGWFLTGG